MRPGEKKEELSQLSQEIVKNHGSFMSNFFWISTNSKGTHALQVFIENLEENNFKEQISKIIENENPLYFAFNKHATHVLIKYIEMT
jgi:hypothetical protein